MYIQRRMREYRQYTVMVGWGVVGDKRSSLVPRIGDCLEQSAGRGQALLPRREAGGGWWQLERRDGQLETSACSASEPKPAGLVHCSKPRSSHTVESQCHSAHCCRSPRSARPLAAAVILHGSTVQGCHAVWNRDHRPLPIPDAHSIPCPFQASSSTRASLHARLTTPPADTWPRRGRSLRQPTPPCRAVSSSRGPICRACASLRLSESEEGREDSPRGVPRCPSACPRPRAASQAACAERDTI